MFYMDPLYIILMLVGLVLIIGPQMYVQSTYKKYLKVPSSSGLTGAEAAATILRRNNLDNIVKIEPIKGTLSDHFDPRNDTIRLSEENYYGRSISAVSVAAHEAGHALQAHRGYFPIMARNSFLPMAMIGDKLGGFLLIAGMIMMFFLGIPGIGKLIAIVGLFLYAAVVAFQFVTLPVEFNASSRAMEHIRQYGIVNAAEVALSRQVLTAAALTYVATALYALMNLLYYAYLIFGRRD